jgi:hypothetical protein
MTMAGIYSADIFCDDCIEDIKNRICDELWENRDSVDCLPNGLSMSVCEDIVDLDSELRQMDERDYDSDEYPKYCDDDEESDCPQHCGSHDGCLNPTALPGGGEVSHCFGNSLTSEGEEYVKEAVREGGEVAALWKEVYHWIDFPGECDFCGCDTDSESDYICESCEESQCVNCGEVTELDDNGECALCNGTESAEA